MCERVFRGNIIFAVDFGKYEIIENGYIVVCNNTIVGVYEELPERYSNARIFDYGDKLIVPGFANLGFSCGDKLSVPNAVEEAIEGGFARVILDSKSGIDLNYELMKTLEESGHGGFISMVVDDEASEKPTLLLSDIEEYLMMASNRYEIVKPLVYIKTLYRLSESDKKSLFRTVSRYGKNIKLSPETFKDSMNFLDCDGDFKKVVSEASKELLKSMDTSSSENLFLSLSEETDLDPSDVRDGIDRGIEFGLASRHGGVRDLFSGLKKSGFSASEIFYLATRGGSVFGDIGLFKEGYQFDALVVDDSGREIEECLSLAERLERFMESELSDGLFDIYVSGMKALKL